MSCFDLLSGIDFLFFLCMEFRLMVVLGFAAALVLLPEAVNVADFSFFGFDHKLGQELLPPFRADRIRPSFYFLTKVALPFVRSSPCSSTA